MPDNETYEHLAKIYLGGATKNKSKKERKPTKLLFSLTLVVISGFAFAGIYALWQGKSNINNHRSVIIEPNVSKINFNLDRAKKETLIYDLKDMNLESFATLEFSLRKSNYLDHLHIRVELSNGFNEKSYLYLTKLPTLRWHSFRFNLKEFKEISHWSNMRELKFIIEEWNTKKKRGVVYIDNIMFTTLQ